AWLNDALAVVVHSHRVLDVEPGATVSLFAVGAPARVTTTGLTWPLNNEVLDPLTSRGVSNRATAPSPEITVSEGAVLAVIP
ncbi:MAG: hypothetical protein OXE45_17140, partial [bacterium]|nr:hypothetical protein [bacterium]